MRNQIVRNKLRHRALTNIYILVKLPFLGGYNYVINPIFHLLRVETSLPLVWAVRRRVVVAIIIRSI